MTRRKWFKGVRKLDDGDTVVVTFVGKVIEQRRPVIMLSNDEVIDLETFAEGGWTLLEGKPLKLTPGVVIQRLRAKGE